MVTKCPLYLLHISPKIHLSVHHYNTREKYSLHLDNHLNNTHTDFGKRLVKFKGSRLRNNLPDNVKLLNSIPAFKNSFKNYLLTA